MKRKIIFSLVASMLFSFTSHVQAVEVKKDINTNVRIIENVDNTDYSEISKAIKNNANILVNQLGDTSVQYAITEGDKVIISDNVGVYSKNENENRSITKDTMYGIGSVSKVYTAAAVMKLVDDGKIDLDLPLVNYIKDFTMADPRYIKITPRMLLNHSAGLIGTTEGNVLLYDDNDTVAFDNFLSELKTQRLKSNPGEISVYSNDAFTLAEVLVERVSGKKFSRYIEENFIKPLGLKNTKTPVDEFDRSQLAKTYTGNSNVSNLTENFMAIGAGGIYSSAENTCKFINAITDKSNKGLLSVKSINSMAEKEYLKGVWDNDAEDNAFEYGLGWDSVKLFPFDRYGIQALAKGGDTLNYHSCIVTLPKYHLTMTVNASGGSRIANEELTINSLIKVLKTKGVISKEVSEDIFDKDDFTRSQVMPETLMKYTGTYAYGNNLMDVKVNKNGELTLAIINNGEILEQTRSTYYHTNSGYFVSKNRKLAFKFKEEKNNETYIEVKQELSSTGLAKIPWCVYYGQKVEPIKLTDEQKKVWEARSKKLYYMVSEKYSSMLYSLPIDYCIRGIDKEYSGYIGSAKIDEINRLAAIAKIPGVYGRDLIEFDFYNDNGVEYLKYRSYLYKDQSCLLSINNNTNKIKIEEDGYAKWGVVSPELDGKTVIIETPKEGAFTLYSNAGACLNNSYVTKNNKVTLKAGQLIVFAGSSNSEFNIKIEE